MSTLPKRLIKLRKAAGLSQEEVADKLEVTRQTVSKWETGQSSPDLDKVLPMCELYGVSPDELLGKNDPEPKYRDEKSEKLDDDGDPENEPLDLKKHLFKRGRDDDSIADILKSILGLVTLIVYLLISFTTMAWHITWILWLVYAVLSNIIELIFKISDPKGKGLKIFSYILIIACLLFLVAFFLMYKN